MITIIPLIRRGGISEGFPPKLSRLKRFHSIFTNLEPKTELFTNTLNYKCIYNTQFSCHSTYTHTLYQYTSNSLIKRQNLYYLHCKCKSYSSLTESEDKGSLSVHNSSDVVSRSPETSTVNNEISYEDYWDDERIKELEKSMPGLVVRGTVFVPAFSTCESKVILSHSETNFNSSGEYYDGALGPELDHDQKNSKKGVKELKIYGFISRNRSFHGDEVIAIKSRRQKSHTPHTVPKETPGECRVIKILKRSPALSQFVATLNLSDFFDHSLNFVRFQPRDTRWPALKAEKSKIDTDVLNKLKSYDTDKKLLCTSSFLDWYKDELEPRGRIIRVIGEIGEAESEMESTMLFHGLDPFGFSPSVLENLNELVIEGIENKWVNREDMNHLFVLSIDPKDAKDLDDALSIEKISTDSGEVRYRIGVHIADVSHYVKDGSPVDLDARKRATSVYLEHRVFPMLPEQLSENLCSLLPKDEKLCFSVFVEISETGNGEKIGNDVYIQSVDFKLTTITSKNRLSYDNAKTMLSNCFTSTNSKGVDITSYTFSNFEKLINNSFDDTKVTLFRLYYLSQKLRFYRLKQLGAVHVDIDGSIRCHIPKLPPVFAKLGETEYFNSRGKLDKKFLMKIEKIPKESHELIEEMMLLANTQVAKFISEKIDLYLLRTHEDTSSRVKSLIQQVIPNNLRELIDFEKMNVTSVLSKCEHYMDPFAFQSLSFSALQKFKEAMYSPINKVDADKVNSHWGLALPVYLHFTSPIRRYPDLLTHRILKNILFSKDNKNSVELLSQICQHCNLNKRRAFDAQKEYKNFAFNKYLQFISFIAKKLDPTQLKSLSISKQFSNSEVENYGYLYSDACVSNIINSTSSEGGNELKTSIVFYIPLLNEQKSISCETLNVTPVVNIEGRGKKRQRVKSSLLNSYYLKNREDEEHEDNNKVQGLSVMMDNKRIDFYIYQRVKVLLISGSKMWTVRLPVDLK